MFLKNALGRTEMDPFWKSPNSTVFGRIPNTPPRRLGGVWKKRYAGSYYSVFANVATKHLGGVFGIRPNIDSTEFGLFQNGLIYDISFIELFFNNFFKNNSFYQKSARTPNRPEFLVPNQAEFELSETQLARIRHQA